MGHARLPKDGGGGSQVTDPDFARIYGLMVSMDVWVKVIRFAKKCYTCTLLDNRCELIRVFCLNTYIVSLALFDYFQHLMWDTICKCVLSVTICPIPITLDILILWNI